MDFNISHPFHCSLPVQLRFSDIDTLGHVNNSVYLSLFDLGKSDYFQRAAAERQDWNNVNVVIANININFLHETHFDEPLVVKTQVDHVGNKSFTVVETRTPAPLPQHWRDCFATFEGREM